MVAAEDRGHAGRPGDVRYRLLETVRDYAAERLAAAGETGPVTAAHTAYYLDLAETAEPRLRTGDQLAWMARLDAEGGNLDTALGRAVAGGQAGVALRLTAARLWYWLLRGQRAEAGEAASAAIGAAGEWPPPGWRSRTRCASSPPS